MALAFENFSDDLKVAVGFHGHLCPGLLIGYKAASIGMARLGSTRSRDEELVAIVENNSCSVDGIQVLTGCTFGKGNLFFRDWGKQVFTLSLRPGKKAIRLAFRGDRLKANLPEGKEGREAFMEALLSAPDQDLFDITEVDFDPPPSASIYPSIPCELCGEPVMEPRLMAAGGKKICHDCLLKADPAVILPQVANFLFETGMLKKTPRAGYQFLGNGSESVAEHSFRTTVLGYLLAEMEPGIDKEKVVKMCLFHDLPEARTGDHNYVNKQYVQVNEEAAAKDAVANIPGGPEIEGLLSEFRDKKTIESELASDADQLDLVVELKEKLDLGNRYAAEWIKYAEKRIRTDVGLKVFKAIVDTDWAGWWFDREREHLWTTVD